MTTTGWWLGQLLIQLRIEDSTLRPAPEKAPIQWRPQAREPRAHKKERAKTTPSTYIYFIQMGPGGPVKIGQSVYPHKRLAALQTGSPQILRILATIRVGQSSSLECQLHKQFAHLRMAGEWFSPGADLMEYIKQHSEKRRENGRQEDGALGSEQSDQPEGVGPNCGASGISTAPGPRTNGQAARHPAISAGARK